MFRKTILAAAAGVLISPIAMAGDINSATDKWAFADELLGLAGDGDVIQGGDLVVVLGAEFTLNDVITLTFSGNALDASTLPTTIDTTDVDCVSGPCSTVTLGQLNADSGSAQYRVTDIDSTDGNTTVGLEVDFTADGPLEFDPAAVLAAGGVTVAYSAETNNGLALDSGAGPVIPECAGINCNARTTAFIQTGMYFGIDAPDPAFNGIVDVNDARESLVNGPDDTGGFSATLNGYEDANDFFAVAFDGHNPTFAGDFAWIADPANAVDDGVVAMGGVCGNIVVTETEISGECLAPFATLTLDPTAQGAATLPATTYSATTDVLYSDTYFENGADDVLTTGSFGVGAWTLNGFQAEVAYMPFQTGIGQVIYFANRSAQDGEISVDWIDQFQNSGSFTIGQSLAGSTRAIGPAINAGLPEAQRNGGRLALTITVNVPACQGQLNAQYNVSGDRAFSVSTNNCSIFAD